jgi:hypothetical protein
MNIHHITLPVEAFLKIPQDERALLVAMGHSLNEFSTFDRLLIATAQFPDEPIQVAYVQSFQMYAVTRVLVGKILEIWKVIEVGFFKSKLSKKYWPKLSSEQIDAVDQLKKFFSNKNTISAVRNRLAFHFSIDIATTAPLGELNDNDLSIYIGPTRASCFYPYSETIFNTELIRLTNCTTMTEAWAKLVGEIDVVDKPLHEFAQGIIHLILEEHIGSSVLREQTKLVDLGGACDLRESNIPVFNRPYYNSPATWTRQEAQVQSTPK